MDTVRERLEAEFGSDKVSGSGLDGGFFEVYVTARDGTVYQLTAHYQGGEVFPGRRARWQFTLLNFQTPRTFFVDASTKLLNWDSPPSGIGVLSPVDRAVLLRIAAAVVNCKVTPFPGGTR